MKMKALFDGKEIDIKLSPKIIGLCIFIILFIGCESEINYDHFCLRDLATINCEIIYNIFY